MLLRIVMFLLFILHDFPDYFLVIKVVLHALDVLVVLVAFAGYNKRCGKGCEAAAWLTRDTAVVRAYQNDPFCAFVFTARAYHDLFTLLGRVSRPAWASSLSKELPLLLVSGEEDPVGGWGKGVRKLAARLEAAGMQRLTLLLYPGMRHEILNELSHEAVWSDLSTWMKSCIK